MTRLRCLVGVVLTFTTPALAKVSDAMQAATIAASQDITANACISLWNAFADNHNALEALDNTANEHSRHIPATWESDYQEKADELHTERDELAVARTDMLTWIETSTPLVDACVARQYLKENDATAFAADIPYNEKLIREEHKLAADIRPPSTGLDAAKDAIDLLTLFSGSSSNPSQGSGGAVSGDGDTNSSTDGGGADPSTAILNDTVDGLNKSANDWGELCVTEDDDRPHCQ